MFQKVIFFFLICFFSSKSYSSELEFFEISPYYFNARALGMGGAHLGLSDDQSALFQNPAGLGQEKKAEVHILPLSIESSDDGYSAYKDGLRGTGGVNLEILDRLAGKNIYARAMYSPVIRAPNFAIGFIWDEQIALYNKNRSLPELRLGYQSTRVVQIGTGFQFGKSRGSRQRPVLKVGVSSKFFWRRGGVRRLSQIEILRLATSGSYDFSSIIGQFNTGIDFDLGAHYQVPIAHNWSIGFGSSWINIGNGIYLNKNKRSAPLEGNLGLGMALSYQSSFFDLNLAYDLHYLQKSSVSFGKKNHLGVEFKFPVFSFYTGLNQAYLTYGVGLNLLFFKINALSYAEELSSFIGQEPNRRYLLKLEATFPF